MARFFTCTRRRIVSPFVSLDAGNVIPDSAYSDLPVGYQVVSEPGDINGVEQYLFLAVEQPGDPVDYVGDGGDKGRVGALYHIAEAHIFPNAFSTSSTANPSRNITAFGSSRSSS